MEPDALRFGGGLGSSLIHPVAALMLIFAVAFMLFLPRNRVLVPFLLMVFLQPLGQVIVAGGIHFPLSRIVFLAGLLKLAIAKAPSKKGRLAGGFNPLDKACIGCALSYAAAFVLLYGNSAALINRLGYLVDSLGAYFLLRFLVQDEADVRRVIKLFALIAVVAAAGMLNEQRSGQDVFGMFGGHRSDGLSLSVSAVRDGKIRSQGPFRIYLDAGVFGATLLPFFLWLWQDRRSRTVAAMGIIASAVMAWTSSSSTPLMAYAGTVGALALWRFRNQMRPIRWALVLTLVTLHLVMKAPVWALIGRVDLTGSSSGYQRFQLIDQAIRHFGDWWLLGAKDYDKWGWDSWDLTDEYVLCALQGGLATLAFLIAMITQGFGKIGRARKLVSGDRGQEWGLWCLGAALFAYVMAFFGIGMNSQMQVEWFALFAIISASTFNAKQVVRPSATTSNDWELVAMPIGDSHFYQSEVSTGGTFRS
jgi:hypothetical protein